MRASVGGEASDSSSLRPTGVHGQACDVIPRLPNDGPWAFPGDAVLSARGVRERPPASARSGRDNRGNFPVPLVYGLAGLNVHRQSALSVVRLSYTTTEEFDYQDSVYGSSDWLACSQRCDDYEGEMPHYGYATRTSEIMTPSSRSARSSYLEECMETVHREDSSNFGLADWQVEYVSGASRDNSRKSTSSVLVKRRNCMLCDSTDVYDAMCPADSEVQEAPPPPTQRSDRSERPLSHRRVQRQTMLETLH
eukprot:CAMPEP_0117536980 /NCGR_PEP_ID=MMETSP0784-20121206/41729_1 /TAXON_ID=39447 /ORGANISM="" /LENGTH=250 /DNA_ID=CAMNT_0005333553 /DNA_START=8 /DNA_END=760 /DNA_ORIENTATION=-